MKAQKRKMPAEDFHRRELLINMAAGGTAGAIAAGATNSLEAVTVAYQTNSNTTISSLIKREGL